MNSDCYEIQSQRGSVGRWLLMCIAAFPVVFVAAVFIHKFRSDAIANPSCEEWIARIERHGFRLLAQKSTKRYDFAVFDAGGSQLALCHRIRTPNMTGSLNYKVSTPDGNEVWTDSLPDRHDELRDETHLNTLGLVSTFVEYYGSMYPISTDHVGPIRVVFTVGDVPVFDELVKLDNLSSPK